jgi:hypothetical protein
LYPVVVALRAPWKAGESGNPAGGGTTASRLAKAARDAGGGDDGTRYITELVAIALGTDAAPSRHPVKVRVQALSILLDRGWGRPKETIEHLGGLDIDVSPDTLRRLSDDDLAAVLDAVRRLSAASVAE